MFNKVSLLFLIENIIIIPINAELVMIREFNNKNLNKFNYFLSYIFFCIFGGIIAYLIGFIFNENSVKFIKFFSYIMFEDHNKLISYIGDKNLISFIIFKSFIPGIPLAALNILCGVFKINFIKFLFATFIYRVIRFLILLTFDKISNRFSLLIETMFGFMLIFISYTIFALMYKTIS